MFHVEKMTLGDLEFAVRLSDTMNWNSVEEDFEYMMSLEPNGCFVLFFNSEKVGIATTISFDKVGWLGNVLVSEKYRGKGGGSLIVKNSIEYLSNKGVETIGLFSYVDRVPFYVKQNFQSDSRFIVLKGKGFSASTRSDIRIAQNDDMQQIFDLDRLCFGGSRRRLLEPVLHDPTNLCHICTNDDWILGFIVAKVFDEEFEIGPLVCRGGYDDVAMDLLKTTLKKLNHGEVSLCVPEKESKILNLLKRNGFREDFSLVRLYRGTPMINDYIYVVESLERG